MENQWQIGKFWKNIGKAQTHQGLCPWTPQGLQAPLQPPAGAPSKPLPLDPPNQDPGAANVFYLWLSKNMRTYCILKGFSICPLLTFCCSFRFVPERAVNEEHCYEVHILGK